VFLSGISSYAEPMTTSLKSQLGKQVVLALGGGAARGFAHIGVIRGLQEQGIEVSAVAGCSIGSVVGGVLAAGVLDDYEEAVRGLSRRDLLAMMDVSLPRGGLFTGEKMARFVHRFIGDQLIEDLELPYRAVAVDLDTGAEFWLERGSLLTAMRASSAIPGVFRPILVEQRWLGDGGLACPLPLEAAADLSDLPVVAVDLNAIESDHPAGPLPAADLETRAPASPGLVRALGAGLAIVCNHLTKAHVACNPPALLLQPKLAKQGLFDVSAVAEVIELGHEVVTEVADRLARDT
jgi:NTE family protein